MTNSTSDNSTGRPITKVCCTGCGNDAHPKGGVYLARGKNCLRSGRSDHSIKICPSRKPNRFVKQVRALEGKLEPSENRSEEESEAVEEVYLYQATEGNSRNPTLTLQVNTVPVTLHLDTQADVTAITGNHFEALFTRDRSGTDPVRFSHRIGLLFTRNRSGTGPERIQNWTCCFAGPVSDPIRTGSRKVPCKHLDRFQTVPCKQKPIRSGSVRNGSGPVPCKRSLRVLRGQAASSKQKRLSGVTREMARDEHCF